MDTDIGAVCAGSLGIQGFAYSAGGASASGQLAIVQALHAVQEGRADVCVAVGALMDS